MLGRNHKLPFLEATQHEPLWRPFFLRLRIRRGKLNVLLAMVSAGI